VKILMLAPQPFFEPRGTPFSEYHRIRALLDLGHTVDLVTYPFGQDVSMPGLRVFRSARPPFVHDVRIGPSLAKVPLDAALMFTALRRALSERYDVIHSHEEGSFIGVLLAALLRVPHLYDMHSSLPQQLVNFGFSRSRVLHAVFAWGERVVIRRSKAVIVICQNLEDTVRTIDRVVPTVLIENAPGSGDAPIAGSGAHVRERLGIPPAAPMILYTGTFEAYQGLDLLYDAAARVIAKRPDARFVLAGGRPEQITRARADADRARLGDAIIFAGLRPSQEIPAYLDAADLLVSPRSTGTNTPLKIYQYLRSGRAIVATRLLTHTQVLDDSIAILTAPTAEAYADGILAGIDRPEFARGIGERARHRAETKYSYEAYLARTRQACAYLTDAPAAQVAGGTA
jgi:glycosyltransferase involved in cell wall biosynthesis